MKSGHLGTERLIVAGVPENNDAMAADTSSAPAARTPAVVGAAAPLAALSAAPMLATSAAAADNIPGTTITFDIAAV
ncbi:Uncharacterised protein [Mycobacterium tuberculosis]|nr:Uncharacterised protein [Mycobacterium tuberculosis]